MITTLLVGLTLLCGDSAADALADGCGAIPVDAKIAEVGAFSNMRHTEEHAYGYTVMLWRSGNCVSASSNRRRDWQATRRPASSRA